MNKCTTCGYNHPAEESCEQAKERLDSLLKIADLCKTGYAGVLSNGNIVDRREHPNAIPIQENKLFGTPKPKMP